MLVEYVIEFAFVAMEKKNLEYTFKTLTGAMANPGGGDRHPTLNLRK